MAAELPTVLILRPNPSFIAKLEAKFNLLKPWDSSLSLDQFLTAPSVKALISNATGPLSPPSNSSPPPAPALTTSTWPSVAARIFAEDVADTAVGLFVDVMRKVSASDRYVRDGLWSSRGDYALGSKIGGKRVGIVGLGNIGVEVAKRLEAFGCRISYNSRSEKPSMPYPFYSNVRELAANSDALIICAALTDQTYHIINNKVLSALGGEGVIVNVGRGAIIDEEELVQCLVRGEIGGAGLDVFENEPQVPKELFRLDNVVLSPHHAVITHESFADLAELVIGNLEAFFSNKPLLSPAPVK